jgi:hypothetical protein
VRISWIETAEAVIAYSRNTLEKSMTCEAQLITIMTIYTTRYTINPSKGYRKAQTRELRFKTLDNELVAHFRDVEVT